MSNPLPPASHRTHASSSPPPLSVAMEMEPIGDLVRIPSTALLLEGEFHRVGNDLLIIGPQGERFTVVDYFASAPPATLTTDTGRFLLPETVTLLLASDTSRVPGTLVAGPEMVAGTPDAIGKVGEIAGKVTAKNKVGVTRTLAKGDPVFQEDVLKTEEGAHIKLTFRDNTLFQLGERANAVLNNYLFNPDAGQGNFEATVTVGAFKFTSGELAKQHPGRHSLIKTPTAQIGVRGSELQGEVTTDGQTTILHTSGVLDVADAQGQGVVTLLQTGMATVVVAGGLPQQPFLAPAALLNQFTIQLPSVLSDNKSGDGNKGDKPVAGKEEQGGKKAAGTTEGAAIGDTHQPPGTLGDTYKTLQESGEAKADSLHVTEPPVTLPPATLPATTSYSDMAIPVTLPPTTELPLTLPPVTEPPTTEPPITIPPVIPPVITPPLTGALMGGLVAGVEYRTPTRSGIVGADGKFQYSGGETVTFSIGNIALGQIKGSAAVTPMTLAAGNLTTATNILRLLQTLDGDSLAANGIAISAATLREARLLPAGAVDVQANSTLFENNAVLSRFLASVTGGDGKLVTAAAAWGPFQESFQGAVWSRVTQGMVDGGAQGESLATDGQANLYASGSFWGRADLDPGAALRQEVASGNGATFLQKLDASGHLLWVETLQPLGNGQLEAGEIRLSDASGQDALYTLGRFTGAMDLNGDGLADLSSRRNGSTGQVTSDLYLVKRDAANGSIVWATTVGGGEDEQGGLLVTQGANGTVLGLSRGDSNNDGSADLQLFAHRFATANGAAVGSDITLSWPATDDIRAGRMDDANRLVLGGAHFLAPGNSEAFVRQMDLNSGRETWSRLFAGGKSSSTALALDGTGNIYVAGRFVGSIDLGNGITLVDGSGGEKLFVAKLGGTDGTTLWAKGFGLGNTAFDLRSDLAVTLDATGLRLAGTLNRAGGNALLVMTLDPNGNLLWQKELDGSGPLQASGIALDNQGGLLVTGSFSGVADLGTENGALHRVAASTGQAQFILKMDAVSGQLFDLAGARVAIDGQANLGDTLTAVAVVDNETVRYQWQILQNGSWVDIGAATSAQFIPGSTEVGHALRVEVFNGSQRIDSPSTLPVTARNHPPEVHDFTRSGTHTDWMRFSAQDFQDHSQDRDGNPVLAIRVTSLPDSTAGILQLDGSAVTIGQEIATRDLNTLTFVPLSSGGGWRVPVRLGWQAWDGHDWSQTAATATLAPSGEPTGWVRLQAVDTTVAGPSGAAWSSTPTATRLGMTYRVGKTASGALTLEQQDAFGQQQWSREWQVDGLGDRLMLTLHEGDIHVAGSFAGSAHLDQTLSSVQGSTDLFMARFDPHGNPLWASSVGGAALDAVNAIQVDGSGTLYLAASLSGVVDLDPGPGQRRVDLGSGTQSVLFQLNGAGMLDHLPSGRLKLVNRGTSGLMVIDTLADADGLESVAYQWQVSNDGLTGWSNIANATADTVALSRAGGSSYLRVVANYTDLQGSLEQVTSLPANVAQNGSLDTAARWSMGGPVTGSIDFPGGSGLYKLSLTEGTVYSFNLRGAPSATKTDGATLSHPALVLRNAQGVTVDDSAGTGETGSVFVPEGDARVVYIPQSSGTYYLEAMGAGSETGAFTLNGKSAQVNTWTLNAPTTGRIDTVADVDWFAVNLTAGTGYTFDLQGAASGHGTLFDGHLMLRNGTGDLIQAAGWGGDARVVYVPTVSGTYYLDAEALYAETGSYTLKATVTTPPPGDAPGDVGSSASTTGRVGVGQSVAGSIDSPGDSDWFAISLTADIPYTLQLQGVSGTHGTLYDPYLVLRNGSGGIIADDNDSGTGWDAKILYTPAVSGTYYLDARGFAAGTGSYTLNAAVTVDVGNSVATAGSLPIGGVTTSEIAPSRDSDWFAVNLTAGVAYTFDLQGASSAQGTLYDPLLVLRDGMGSSLVSDDDSGAGWDARIVYTPTISGTYYLTAQGVGSNAGTYTLSSRETVTVPLAHLNGSTGFRLDGATAEDSSGWAVSSAGDVNGDGFDDVIVGAKLAAAGAGSSYVLFGRSGGFGSALNLSSLDGNNGFRLDGAAADDQSGIAVHSAGDVNGDGWDDLIIGARYADPRTLTNAGSSYVVFGHAGGFNPVINLSSLNGRNGFRMDGVAAADQAGYSASSAGDVNGDGLQDLIVGALPGAGSSYVLFGRVSGIPASISFSQLNGKNGFVLDGMALGDQTGFSVGSAGDVNGDGFADLIVGRRSATSNTLSGAFGYVVFGHATGFASSFNLSSLNGSNGFRLDGGGARDYSGIAVSSAGDVNGDGLDDLIVGAYGTGPTGHFSNAGSTYVVFGQSSGLPAGIQLANLNGANGFRLDGVARDDASGRSVSAAGDVNGDGFADLLVGAYGFDSGAGASYVVFGHAAGFQPVLNLATLGHDAGFRLDGATAGDLSGRSVSGAGDVNGDGFADLIVGAYGAGPGGRTYAGSSYVIFGSDPTGVVQFPGTSGADTLSGTAAAESFVGGNGADTLTGGGGADVFHGGSGNDTLVVSDLSFRLLDGGTGTDTLALSGTAVTLNLANLRGRIASIETINLTAAGQAGNTLVLTSLDLLNLSDNTNLLTVEGDGSDIVRGGTGWTDKGIRGDYHLYTKGQAELRLAKAVIFCQNDPLVLDLDGDGVHLTAAGTGAHFDMNGDGVADPTGWIGQGDGLLVWDQNGDGRIAGMQEVISPQAVANTTSSLAALATLDSNRDGQMDDRDIAFARLQVWVDQNQDGLSTPQELHPLSQLGIVSLGLTLDPGEPQTMNGNTVTGVAHALYADGHRGDMAEVQFDFEVATPLRTDGFSDLIAESHGSADGALYPAGSTSVVVRHDTAPPVLSATTVPEAHNELAWQEYPLRVETGEGFCDPILGSHHDAVPYGPSGDPGWNQLDARGLQRQEGALTMDLLTLQKTMDTVLGLHTVGVMEGTGQMIDPVCQLPVTAAETAVVCNPVDSLHTLLLDSEVVVNVLR
ncbi:MAG: FecR domain-containing protein [Magnetococcus sp. MYC-9]